MGPARRDVVEEIPERAAPGQCEGPADLSDVGVGRGYDTLAEGVGQPKRLGIDAADAAHVVFEDREELRDLDDGAEIGLLPGSCQNG